MGQDAWMHFPEWIYTYCTNLKPIELLYMDILHACAENTCYRFTYIYVYVLAITKIMKQRVNKINKQLWLSDVDANDQCLIFRIFKRKLEFEKFLEKLDMSAHTVLMHVNFQCYVRLQQ